MSGGKGSSDSDSKVRIPRFLKPFVQQSTGVASDALTALEGLIGSGEDLVAGFTPLQELAQLLGISRASETGELFGEARDIVSGLTEERDVLDFLPDVSRNVLTSLAAGGEDTDLTDILGVDTLTQILDSGGAVSPDVLSNLEATARGDFLFGGQGFDEAVSAAVRAAAPQIISTFKGQGGVGAGSGALSQAAVGESAVDAFASQFSTERGRQLEANQLLADIGLEETGLRSDIANSLATLGVDVDQFNRGAQNTAAEILAGFGIDEQASQDDLNKFAADFFKELGTDFSDVELLRSLGLEQQELEQLKLTQPIDAFLTLINAALGGVPVSDLLGRKTETDDKFLGFKFG